MTSTTTAQVKEVQSLSGNHKVKEGCWHEVRKHFKKQRAVRLKHVLTEAHQGGRKGWCGLAR
jgi:hypothetical protein